MTTLSNLRKGCRRCRHRFPTGDFVFSFVSANRTFVVLFTVLALPSYRCHCRCRCRGVLLLLLPVYVLSLLLLLSLFTQGGGAETRDPERQVHVSPRTARSPGPRLLEWLLRADWLDAYRRPSVAAALSRDNEARAGAHDPSLIKIYFVCMLVQPMRVFFW